LTLWGSLINIREAKEDDLTDIFRIEVECFGKHAYPLRLLRMLLILHGDLFLVAEEEGRLIGYVVAAEVKGRGHILSIAVDPPNQRRGVGSRLFEEVMRRLRDRGFRRFKLEVRVDNYAARRFYEKHGFKAVGFIKSYYDDGASALVYEKIEQ